MSAGENGCGKLAEVDSQVTSAEMCGSRRLETLLFAVSNDRFSYLTPRGALPHLARVEL